MVFDVNDILKQLEGGAEINDIATAAANAINEAVKLQEKKKKDAETALAKEVKENKIQDAGYLIEEVIDFFHEYYPEIIDDKGEISDAKVRSIAEELVDVFDRAYKETIKFINSDEGKLFKDVLEKGNGDAIEKFLRENNLF